MKIDDVLTFAEAAEKWGLDSSTLRHWVRQEKFELGEVRKSGKVWLITRQAMERIMNAKKI